VTLLALETSGSLGSVALAVGGEVVARRMLDEPREHASRLIPAVAGVLDEAGVARRALGGVVVGAGPGSFTGVRVAAAAGKGLVHALGIPLWAVSSLEAAALGERGDEPSSLVVLFDARGRRLFVGAYDWSGGALRARQLPRFATLDQVLQDPDLAGAPLAGEGALRHRIELEARGRAVLEPPAGVPTADALIRRVLDGGVAAVADPGGWEPDYLRATGAERERLRHAPSAMG
jgi:tRNA threonylcarbamoyladenosine biosynthesis protein TsaB